MIKNYLKNKKLGFYFVLASITLSVVLAIVFLATYKLDNGNGQFNLTNSSYALKPETIAIFALAGAVIDIVALVLPEYILIHVGALACYVVSLIKVIRILPDLIAGQITGIAYEGGNFPLNMVFLFLSLAIAGLAVATCFIGVIKDEDEEKKMREMPDMTKWVKIGACGFVAFATVLTSVIVSNNLAKSSATTEESMTKKLLKQYGNQLEEYDFDPNTCIFKEDEHPFADVAKNTISSTVGTNLDKRLDADGYEMHKVYTFEGSTAEGWQGDYSLKKGFLTLWEDGLYNGTSNGTNIYGYWYNQDSYGEECLTLISKSDDNNMVCNKLAGSSSYYEWSVDMKASYNGGRLIKVQGLKYYPTVAMYVDTGADDLKYPVGTTSIDTSKWTFNQVIGGVINEEKFIKAGSIFDAEHTVKLTLPDTSSTGEKEVTAKWGDFETTVKIQIVEE